MAGLICGHDESVSSSGGQGRWRAEPGAQSPNAARMYDYYLGGSANLRVDRVLADEIVAMRPELPAIARANRAYLRRTVRLAIDLGVRQFLDLGSGVPTVGNVHEVALAADPRSRVVYVDHEPVAATYAAELVAHQPQVAVLHADLRDHEQVLTRAAATGLIDFQEPVALLAVAVLHFLPDTAQPAELLAHYRRALPANSLLAISHGTTDQQPPAAVEGTALYHATNTPLTLRTHEQVTALMAGTHILEPGVVFTPQWRPDSASAFDHDPSQAGFYAAVGVVTHDPTPAAAAATSPP